MKGSQQSMNQFVNNFYSSQLKGKNAQNDEELSQFERNLRSYYDICEECKKKEANQICLSIKCTDYFKLVCPYCHKMNHKIDVTLTYQFQDIDSFMQEVVKISRQKTIQSQQTITQNKLFDIIDKQISEVDRVLSTIESIKNVLEYKKMTLSKAFDDYEQVYEEMKRIYKPSNRYINLQKTLNLLNKKLHYKKGTNGMWQLTWKNENDVQNQFFKPLMEVSGAVPEQQQSPSKYQKSEIPQIDEDYGENQPSSESIGESKPKSRFNEQFNQAIEQIQNTLAEIQAQTQHLVNNY